MSTNEIIKIGDLIVSKQSNYAKFKWIWVSTNLMEELKVSILGVESLLQFSSWIFQEWNKTSHLWAWSKQNLVKVRNSSLNVIESME